MNRLPCKQLRDAMLLATAKTSIANDNGDLSKRQQLRGGQQRGRREATTSLRRRQRRRRRIRHPP